MNETIRLGRIAGIAVGLNWSLIVIFVLVATALAGGRFPAVHPGHGAAAYVVAGVATALLFFCSILAHELGHALVARRNGVEVEGITLWLFGGVARLGGESPDPGAELRIAAVGPAISVLVGAAAGAAAVLLDLIGAHELLVGTATWLAIINVVLAVFNLLPGAPLDGGRILRALLWWRSGDRVGSAVKAARGGRAIGWLLVVLGVLEFAAGAGLGGLWFALIGWFLINVARAEEGSAVLRGALGGITVRQAMSPDPVTVHAAVPVSQLIDEYLFRHRFSAFPVLADDGRPPGLVTLNAMKAVAPDRRPTTPVGDIAYWGDEVPRAAPDDALAELLPRLNGAEGRALVFDRGRLVGIVSPTDVARIIELAELGAAGHRLPLP